jgi:hypothetical protein
MLVPGAITATLAASVMNVRLEEGPDDAVGGFEAAARCVQADDDGGGSVIGRGGQALGDVARHDLVDDPVGGQDDHITGIGRSQRAG